MYIIGFDVSKNELVGVLINKRGNIKETYAVINDQESIDQFLDELPYTKVTIGSEATGEYHNLLALSCIKRDLPFYVLNPIVTKQFTRATVRKKKTDLTDAHVIAKCILQGEGERVDVSCFDTTKAVLRTASVLSRISVMLNHMNKRFEYHHKSEGFVQDELHMLHNAVAASVKSIQQYGIEQTDSTLQKLLCSIPGIGPTLAAYLIAEIGNPERFHSAKAVVAYAGLDPKVRQSGISMKRNTKLTKRGSPYLRRSLYIAASIAQRHDEELRVYFEKKRSEGKRYKEATVANARHILLRVYAVWKRGTPYVPRLSTN